ncbi:type I-C CRISPR-associated protein Cas8c/Csd1 [Paenibacillus anaericanus]|uniref:Type I-C CRISPR-associated protein Cas8c/Csd1 n=1 Tax=Paenibacillus anaericanus TaxID=170367 RepID=A0A433Y512_9BACL|nr:type I-C CRISPR-associated protein Cas8c/Csd1 [Paenibacillus anaericanus]RUT43740.1 type I-C CRISPR-associated protein Cas8c/Csd1 [Paenibacillus anaericanus]
MSWLLNLYETYESNLDRVGIIEQKYNGQEYTLLPVSHTTQNAHIEVGITEDGEFHSAFVIDKNDMSTLIPCTEKSASRAGKVISPYPLHDKLVYVAGDFTVYSGEGEDAESFIHYIKQLGEWANSPHGTSKVRSIYNYLKKGQLIRDLVEHNILFIDSDHRLIEKWDKKYELLHSDKPPIFAAVAGGQESAFIRFNVYSPSDILTEVWKDQEMYNSFIQYYRDLLGNEDICYVTGQTLPSTDKHANKIRNAADKAKLISANDSSGFTYRGRFNSSNEAASISYEVSQKAHNALKWLINRQGRFADQRVFLVWGNDALDIPDPTVDTFAIDPRPIILAKKSYTNQEYANEVSKALDGYRNDLSTKADVNIMILDSATTGRMAVLHYRNMDKNLYLDKLEKWHSTCVWLHRYRKDDQGEFVQFIGAPATKDIAFAAYGPRANEKIVKGLMERMLPCIVDDIRIPQDIVNSAIHRATNPVSMEKWEWEKTLSIACALINRQEGLKLALDTETDDRDYLFGRLLAVADVLERRALGDEMRSSNAIRYMNSFSMHPERTWMTIQRSLQPYQARLGTKATYLSKIIDEVASKFKVDDFSNKPLSGKYLLGFYSQRHELYQKKENNNNDAVNASNEE